MQNFAVTVTQSELNGEIFNADGTFTNTGALLDKIELILTLVFTAELLFNMYSHWFSLFFHSGYNVVDLIAITLSLIALGPLNINFSVLRLIRACRVVRIFGRFKSLKAIISALAASLIPVLNAFVILLLLMAICEH